MPDYDYDDTITIRETPVMIYYYYQGSIISISNSNEFHWFYKDYRQIAFKDIVLSNISFAIILTNIFCKAEVLLFSYFVNLDKKFQNGIIEGKKCAGPKTIKTINRWRD